MNAQLSSIQPYDQRDVDLNSNIFSVYVDRFGNCMPVGEVFSFENAPINKYFALVALREENNVDEWPVSNEFQDLMSEVCFEFCNARGLIPALRLCVNKIKELFSGIVEFHVELDHFEDDETPDEGHIVFRVSTKPDCQIVMEEYDKWIDWLVDTVDEDKQSLITLTID